jgi:hypothetical protein
MALQATILNCTLKPFPEPSNTEVLASVVIDALESADVRTSASCWFAVSCGSLIPSQITTTAVAAAEGLDGLVHWARPTLVVRRVAA